MVHFDPPENRKRSFEMLEDIQEEPGQILPRVLPDTTLKPEPVPSGTIQGKVIHLSYETSEDPGTLLKALPLKDISFLQAFGCRVGNSVEVVTQLSAEAPRRNRAALASLLTHSGIVPKISAFKTSGADGPARTFKRVNGAADLQGPRGAGRLLFLLSSRGSRDRSMPH